jgi:hypothetical protein
MNKLTRNLLILGLALGAWGISFLFTGNNDAPTEDPTREICYAQLDQIQRAKVKWAAEHKQPNDAVPTMNDLLPYLLHQKAPECPGLGKYTINAVTNPPRCSITTHGYP